jgi:hypothetical protein
VSGYMPDSSLVLSSNTDGLIWKCSEHIHHVTGIVLLQLNSRVRNQIDEKRRLVTALSASVPPEGQKLFFAISKT